MMSKRFSIGVLIMAAGVGLAPSLQTARGQCQLNELAKLTASDGAAYDLLGHSVSLSGDVAVIGAPSDDDVSSDDPGCNSGSAYVYRFDGTNWIEEAKLTASDLECHDWFGCCLSVSADVVVVGAQNGDAPDAAESGSAYVFRYNGSNWIEEAKLTASDAALGDWFGWSVSLSGDVAVIGAMYDDDAGRESGSVYVFRFNGTNWIEEAKLTASDAAEFYVFGYSVSITGDVALIGATGDSDMGASSGAAYVYRFDGANWIEEPKLTASDAEAYDYFGHSVFITGDVALIGAYRNDGGYDSGAAYVFRFNGINWIEEAKLTASDPEAYDYFGSSLSLSGDVAVIGASRDDDGADDSGSAYVYRFDPDKSGWIEDAKLTASDPGLDHYFGSSVTISGDLAVIGASGDNDMGSFSGSAYVFRSLSDCNDTGTLDACDLVDGLSEDCNGNAFPDECDIADGTSEDDNGNGIPDDCILASNPPDGAIDARQPTEVDGAGDYGWSEVELTFDGDVTGLTPEDFTVTLDPPGTPPFLASVTADGNVALLEFGDLAPEPIPTGHWTIITHNDSSGSVRIGYLPADVNGDHTSAAVDILGLIDFLNGVGDALEIWQSDTDRSGEANPADILRVIDLLNGAGAFETWNGESLPQ